MKKLKYSLYSIIISIFTLFGVSNAELILLIDDDNQLYGATGVDVGGVSYDVEFVDGICTNIFSGCDSSDDFDFTNAFDASVASQALLNQVLVGEYDLNPDRTRGIEATLGNYGIILTPYSIEGPTVQTYGSWNSDTTNGDIIGLWSWDSLDDTGGSEFFAFADWSPSAVDSGDPVDPTAPVPEPTTLLLFGAGLAGLAGVNRRKIKK